MTIAASEPSFWSWWPTVVFPDDPWAAKCALAGWEAAATYHDFNAYWFSYDASSIRTVDDYASAKANARLGFEGRKMIITTESGEALLTGSGDALVTEKPAPVEEGVNPEIVANARAAWDDNVGWLIKTAEEDGPDQDRAEYCLRVIRSYVNLASAQYGQTDRLVERVSLAYEAIVGPARSTPSRRARWVREKLAPALVSAMLAADLEQSA